MHKYFLVISFLVLFFSCTEDHAIVSEGEEASRNVLAGKWQVVESFYSIGTAEQLSSPVENGSILNLGNNGEFETNLVEKGKDGTFKIEGDSLIMNFTDLVSPSEYIYRFAIRDGSLHLSPISPYICIEGCSQRLEKID